MTLLAKLHPDFSIGFKAILSVNVRASNCEDVGVGLLRPSEGTVYDK